MSSLKPPPSASTSSYKLYSPPPLTTPRNPFASSSSTLHSTNISAYQPSTTSYTPRTTFSLDKNRTMYTNEIKKDSDEDDDENDEKLMYSTRGRGSERGSRGSEIPLSISAGGTYVRGANTMSWKHDNFASINESTFHTNSSLRSSSQVQTSAPPF